MSELFIALDTIPDVSGLRRLNRLPDELSDAEVAEYAFQRRRASTGEDSVPPQLQKLAAYACFGQEGEGFRLGSAAGMDEAQLLESLFAQCASAKCVARWSEQEASLPSLRWRALQAGISAGPAWPALEACRDLAALLSATAEAPALACIASLAGLPLVQGADEERAWQAAQAKDWLGMRARAELRVIAAWRLGLRYRCLSGGLSAQVCQQTERRLQVWLGQQEAAHLQGFAAG